MIKLAAQMAMKAEVNDKISAFLLQAGNSPNKKITSFNLIHLHLLKKDDFKDVYLHHHRVFFC